MSNRKPWRSRALAACKTLAEATKVAAKKRTKRSAFGLGRRFVI